MKMTDITARNCREIGWHKDQGDGAVKGLYLKVTASESADKRAEPARSWVLRVMMQGRALYMGLGSVRDVSLKQARKDALAARALAKQGRDPITERRAMIDSNLARKTFAQVAADYIAAHSHGWKNPKHAAQWRKSLTKFKTKTGETKESETKAIADLPIESIKTAHVADLLRPLWHSTPESAARLRGRIESVLTYAAAVGYIPEGTRNAADGEIIRTLLGSPPRSRGHHAALAYVELPAFMARLRDNESTSARALEFCILTAARTGEVMHARWSEISGDVWTVPAERMKAGKEHRVPLAARALAILESLPRNGDVIFAHADGAALSNMAMLEMVRGLAPGVTVHGFRSTFRDWARERTAFPRDIAEQCLAHALKDKTEAAYRRGDALDIRRKLMDAWASYCETPPAAVGDVIPLRAHARAST
jgi:integrase